MDMISIRRKLMAYIPPTTPGVLPAEYQQVEFLESDKNSYIDTGIILTEANYTVLADVMLTATQDCNLFGIRKYQTGQHSSFVLGAKNAYARIGTNWQMLNNSTAWIYSTGNDVFLSQRYTIKAQYGSSGALINVNGDDKIVLSFTPRWEEFADLSLWLYAAHAGYQSSLGVDKCYQMRVYSFEIKRGTRSILDLIPCYRKADNTPGMYDLISQTFLTNLGTGTFTVGPDIN